MNLQFTPAYIKTERRSLMKTKFSRRKFSKSRAEIEYKSLFFSSLASRRFVNSLSTALFQPLSHENLGVRSVSVFLWLKKFALMLMRIQFSSQTSQNFPSLLAIKFPWSTPSAACKTFCNKTLTRIRSVLIGSQFVTRATCYQLILNSKTLQNCKSKVHSIKAEALLAVVENLNCRKTKPKRLNGSVQAWSAIKSYFFVFFNKNQAMIPSAKKGSNEMSNKLTTSIMHKINFSS